MLGFCQQLPGYDRCSGFQQLALRFKAFCASRALLLPATPDLPRFRVNDWKSFSSVGVDFSGNSILKSRHFQGVIYVSFLVSPLVPSISSYYFNMSIQSFVLAFRGHCADYTTPKLIISDNANTFKRADIELKKLFSSVWSKEAATFLSQRRISLRGIYRVGGK